MMQLIQQVEVHDRINRSDIFADTIKYTEALIRKSNISKYKQKAAG